MCYVLQITCYVTTRASVRLVREQPLQARDERRLEVERRVEAAPQAGAPYVVAGTYSHQLPDAKAVEAFEKSLP